MAEDDGFQLSLLLGNEENWCKVAGAKRWTGRAVAYWLVPSSGSGVRSCTINFATLDNPLTIQSYRITTSLEVGRPAPSLELLTEPTLGESLATLAFRLLKATAFADSDRSALHRHAQEWRRMFGREPRVVTLGEAWYPIADLDQESTRKTCEYNGRSIEAFFKGPVIEVDPERQVYRVLFVPPHQYASVQGLKPVRNSMLFMSPEGIYSYDGTGVRLLFSPPTSNYEITVENDTVSVTYTDPASPFRVTHSASFEGIA